MIQSVRTLGPPVTTSAEEMSLRELALLRENLDDVTQRMESLLRQCEGFMGLQAPLQDLDVERETLHLRSRLESMTRQAEDARRVLSQLARCLARPPVPVHGQLRRIDRLTLTNKQ